MNNIPTNESILYQLFNDDNFNKILGVHTSHKKEEGFFPVQINFAHDGSLRCKASVQNSSKIRPTFSEPKVFKVVGEFIK